MWNFLEHKNNKSIFRSLTIIFRISKKVNFVFLSVNENEGYFHLQIPRYEGFFKVINVKKKHDKSITPKSKMLNVQLRWVGTGRKLY